MIACLRSAKFVLVGQELGRKTYANSVETVGRHNCQRQTQPHEKCINVFFFYPMGQRFFFPTMVPCYFLFSNLFLFRVFVGVELFTRRSLFSILLFCVFKPNRNLKIAKYPDVFEKHTAGTPPVLASSGAEEPCKPGTI